MVDITKSEMEFMIQNNILKCVRGQYPGLVVTSKRKKSNGKQRQIEEPKYNPLRHWYHRNASAYYSTNHILFL